MRHILVFSAVLLLAGCQSYFDDQQRQVDEANAKRDRAWCESAGVSRGDPRYLDCRAMAAEIRLTGGAQRDARALGLMGLGTTLVIESQDGQTTTCQTFGSTTTCSDN